ncbi:MarR family winged helix-turn-helix transcriptional regulator [Streptomyces flaveolus]|uniref:MarR family winged helix-turn-helix transcriptional regulator n=1 Tax=Streptomyces flaveolus TaxID=67297 RepID=UPI00344010FC
MLNQLSDAGCIRRAPGPADRRRNVITPTPAGRRRLEHLDGLITAAQQEPLAPLTPEQRDNSSVCWAS